MCGIVKLSWHQVALPLLIVWFMINCVWFDLNMAMFSCTERKIQHEYLWRPVEPHPSPTLSLNLLDLEIAKAYKAHGNVFPVSCCPCRCKFGIRQIFWKISIFLVVQNLVFYRMPNWGLKSVLCCSMYILSILHVVWNTLPCKLKAVKSNPDVRYASCGVQSVSLLNTPRLSLSADACYVCSIPPTSQRSIR